MRIATGAARPGVDVGGLGRGGAGHRESGVQAHKRAALAFGVINGFVSVRHGAKQFDRFAILERFVFVQRHDESYGAKEPGGYAALANVCSAGTGSALGARSGLAI